LGQLLDFSREAKVPAIEVKAREGTRISVFYEGKIGFAATQKTMIYRESSWQ
jgi:hypothetical protein